VDRFTPSPFSSLTVADIGRCRNLRTSRPDITSSLGIVLIGPLPVKLLETCHRFDIFGCGLGFLILRGGFHSILCRSHPVYFARHCGNAAEMRFKDKKKKNYEANEIHFEPNGLVRCATAESRGLLEPPGVPGEKIVGGERLARHLNQPGTRNARKSHAGREVVDKQCGILMNHDVASGMGAQSVSGWAVVERGMDCRVEALLIWGRFQALAGPGLRDSCTPGRPWNAVRVIDFNGPVRFHDLDIAKDGCSPVLH